MPGENGHEIRLEHSGESRGLSLGLAAVAACTAEIVTAGVTSMMVANQEITVITGIGSFLLFGVATYNIARYPRMRQEQIQEITNQQGEI